MQYSVRSKRSTARTAGMVSELQRCEEEWLTTGSPDCTSAVTNLLLHTISNEANLLDSFVVLHAALCTALYRVIGMEFGEFDPRLGMVPTLNISPAGAHLVQTLIDRYTLVSENKASSANLADETGKQPLNLLVLISELYNFQVVSCRLIYDLIREFIEALPRIGSPAGDFAVEALLKVLKGECDVDATFDGQC